MYNHFENNKDGYENKMGNVEKHVNENTKEITQMVNREALLWFDKKDNDIFTFNDFVYTFLGYFWGKARK